uniref:Uncharacterized protein n=1 Tax=Euplotes harpa TaxID=151035 RepID=A0A7S3JJQ5_9SPIT|mmetsp:Transcript_40559/g.46524  ORF Transcript_40559/g.46524 Transcript_40559/m.46524 type:complete len:156 (+) Transcript_40559:372-839(+)
MVCDKMFFAREVQEGYISKIEREEIRIKTGEQLIDALEKQYDRASGRVQKLVAEDRQLDIELKVFVEEKNAELKFMQENITEFQRENDELKKKADDLNDKAQSKIQEKDELFRDIEVVNKQIKALVKAKAALESRLDEISFTSGSRRGTNYSQSK